MNSRQLNRLLLATNVGLAALAAGLFLSLKRNPAPVPPDLASLFQQTTVTQIEVRKFNATNLLMELANRRISWRAIESTNYLIFIYNLRSIGCPEEVIRDIIVADVAKAYNAKRRQLYALSPPPPFWQTLGQNQALPGFAPEMSGQFRALETEQRQLVKSLLGVDYNREIQKYLAGDGYDGEGRYLTFLPQEKQQAVQDLFQVYDMMEQRIYAAYQGAMPEEEAAQLQALQAQRSQELVALLNPEELETYQLYTSPIADGLRHQLDGFDPTPDEFRQIFKLYQEYEQVVTSTLHGDDLSPEARREGYAAAEALLQQELMDQLGERYSNYAQVTDPDYQLVRELTAGEGATGELAPEVYSMKQQALRQKQLVEGNADLTPEQRQQALIAIQNETERSLAALLGGNVYQAYQNAGGQWIGSLGMDPFPAETASEGGETQAPPPPQGPLQEVLVPVRVPIPNQGRLIRQ